MHDPTNDFSGCNVKFKFPDQDLEVSTIEDIE